jgi:hypothetical protein
MTSITYAGLDEIIRSLDRLPSEVGPSIREELGPLWKEIAGKLADYPSPPPGSTYDRTGALGEGWLRAQPQYIVRATGGIDARLSNDVPYTDYVQGDDQAPIHQGRWVLAATVLTEYEQDITLAAEQGVMAAFRRVGLD